MAKEQILTQILYKYPNDDMITENFDIEQDVCDFLGC